MKRKTYHGGKNRNDNNKTHKNTERKAGNEISDKNPNSQNSQIMTVKGEIIDFTADGKGVLRQGGVVYFTEGGVIGDIVIAEVRKLKKNFSEAEVVEILKPSPLRVPSDCASFSGIPSSGAGEKTIAVSPKCGGCDFRNFTYEAQLEWKKNAVLSALAKIGGIRSPEIDLAVGAEREDEKYGYRNNIQLPVRLVDGTVRIGFFEGRSNVLVPFDICHLMPSHVAELIHTLEFLINESGIPVQTDDGGSLPPFRQNSCRNDAADKHPARCGKSTSFDSESNSKREADRQKHSQSVKNLKQIDGGPLKHIGIRISHAGELVLIFVTEKRMMEYFLEASRLPENRKSDVEDFPSAPCRSFEELFRKYHIISVYENVNPRNHQTFGPEWHLIHGQAEWEECILDRRFKLVPASFFQVNRRQTEKLYRIAISYALGESFSPETIEGSSPLDVCRQFQQNCPSWNQDALASKTCNLDAHASKKIGVLLDLYCGVGSIGICASDFAEEIVGIEVVEEAVQNARKNAELNGVRNARYYAGACENLLSGELKHINPEVVILDPPRAGADVKVLHALTGKDPERIVYVSCNPSTLARDIKVLIANGYTLKKVSVVDMFPFTTRIEFGRKQKADGRIYSDQFCKRGNDC